MAKIKDKKNGKKPSLFRRFLTYAITVKKKEALNQWLDEQLKAGLIVELSLRYQHYIFIFQRKMNFYDWYKTIESSIL